MGQINAGKFIASTGIEFPSYTESQKTTNLEWNTTNGERHPDGLTERRDGEVPRAGEA